MSDPTNPPTYDDLVASRFLVKLLIDPVTGRVLDASQAAADFYRYSREELRQFSIWDISPDRPRDETLALFAVLATEQDLSPGRHVRHRLHGGESREVMVLPDLVERDGRVLILATVADITQWRQTEARLTPGEEQFRALIEQGLYGVVEVDVHGRLTRVNARFCQLLGSSRERLLQRMIQDLMEPEDRAAGRALIERLLAGGVAEPIEVCFRRPDGGLVCCLASVASLSDEAGQIVGFVGLLTDITAHRKAEERLQKTEQCWKYALDGAGHGVWDWSIATDTVDFSLNWKRMLGYEEEDIRGQLSEWLIRVHPEDRHAIEVAVKAHLDGETASYESVHRVRCKDGSWKWILARGMIFECDAAGKPLRMVGTHTDITAQKQAEEDLRRTQYRLAEAQRIAHLGSFEYDAATHETRWSDEEYRIFGLDPAGPSPDYDTMLAHFIHPDDAALMDQRFRADIATRSAHEQEHRIVRPDGSVRWVYVQARPYFDGHGALVRYIGTNLDITERKQAEDDLRHLHATLTAALSAMSDAVFVSDADGRIIYFNDAFVTFFRFKQDEEWVRPLVEYPDILDVFLPDGTLAPLEQWAMPRALRGETVVGAKYGLQRKDTGETWLGSFNIAPIHAPDGTIVGSVVTGREITDDQKR